MDQRSSSKRSLLQDANGGDEDMALSREVSPAMRPEPPGHPIPGPSSNPMVTVTSWRNSPSSSMPSTLFFFFLIHIYIPVATTNGTLRTVHPQHAHEGKGWLGFIHTQ